MCACFDWNSSSLPPFRRVEFIPTRPAARVLSQIYFAGWQKQDTVYIHQGLNFSVFGLRVAEGGGGGRARVVEGRGCNVGEGGGLRESGNASQACYDPLPPPTPLPPLRPFCQPGAMRCDALPRAGRGRPRVWGEGEADASTIQRAI